MGRVFKLEDTRNIGIMAHIDAGKTTSTERILFYTGVTYKIGSVDEGTATMDWMEQERERGITITSAATTASWDRFGKKYRINTIRKRLGAHPVPLQFPLGREDNFIGIIDFLEEKVIVWLEETLGAKFEIFEVGKLWDKPFVDSRPDVAAALKGSAIDKKFYDEHRNKVVEYVAEHDDAVLEKFLSEHDLTPEDLRASIRRSTLAMKIVPVLAGSAFKNKGIQPLLDAVVDFLPSPVDVPPVEGINP